MSQTAILAARASDEPPDTGEIRNLAKAADYQPIGEITQRGEDDPTYSLGRGKAEALMRLAASEEADTVIFDGGLTPGQTASLSELMPAGTDVLDRTRLVLELFATRAGSAAATTQAELARLRYLKPRLTEFSARGATTENEYHSEGAGRVQDLERQITSLEQSLSEITADRDRRREQRRSEGFDLVALTGYTNAGKSTLLQQLADDLDTTEPAGHDDLDSSAAAADALFGTVETTTHRATIDGRRLLLTDTVGFVEGLPHEFVQSFESTIDAARDSDAVLLVTDASDAPERFATKLGASLAAIDHTDGRLIPVLTKTDRVTESAVAQRMTTTHERLETWAGDATKITDPVAISSRDGSGIETLRDQLRDVLPVATESIRLPNGGDAQSLLSWAYDHCDVSDVEYGDSSLGFTVTGNPEIIAEIRRRANRIQPSGGDDSA
ncbi:MAG: GTP-binding protein HflX [Halorubrum sp. J07HR59]|nr:MAG: GTP-binding protein HflX [Halorubrum sp. J07HR59]